MPFFQGSLGSRLHYLDWGDGPPVVFSHGWSLGADAWEYQMLALSERGARCIAHDRRGCGNSDRAPTGYDFDTFADDLNALLEHLDLDDVTLVAHSMGAGEVARLLTRHGTRRVERIALIAPITPCLLRRPDNPDGVDGSLFDAMIAGIVADRPGWMTSGAELFFGRNVLPDSVDDRVIDWGRNLILRSSPHATVEMVRAWSTADFRGDLASFTVPTLVVHGDADQIAPLELTGAHRGRDHGRSTRRVSGGTAWTVRDPSTATQRRARFVRRQSTTEDPMNLTSSYPVLMTADVEAASSFYRDVFGFETTFESQWYVSLRRGQWELALLSPSHATIPEAFRGTTARGVLVNFEVDDVDAVHADVVARGIAPVLELRSEAFGQRHFIVAGPDGVLVDVITPIPPEGEFVAQFLADGDATST